MITRRQFANALAGIAAGAALARPGRVWAERAPLRVGISMETLAGANLNDARAAYRVWADEVAQTLSLRHAEILDQVFIPSADLVQMIRKGQVDFFALIALEYAQVIDLVDPDWVLIEYAELGGMDYVLLVHNDSPYNSLQDLKGAHLLTHHNRSNCLLQPWLSILLANARCPDVDQYFESHRTHDQITQVILPVFFRKAQAAGLSRQAFNMAVELNPQLGRDLRILATSPKVIPNGFWARKDCDAEDKRGFEQAMLRLNTIPAGKQVLALYQIPGFAQRSCSIMTPTLDLIRQYESIRRRPGAKP